jgi:hypothetical protein
MNNTMKEIKAIACVKEPLEVFAYREVIVKHGEKFYLENVNVLFGRKILEKIRFEPGEKLYEKGMGEKIALQYLEDLFENNKSKRNKNKKSAEKKTKINKKASVKAAADIFNSMGL